MSVEYMVGLVVAISQLIKDWLREYFDQEKIRGWISLLIVATVTAGVVFVPMYAPPILKTCLIVFALAAGLKKYLVNPMFKK